MTTEQIVIVCWTIVLVTAIEVFGRWQNRHYRKVRKNTKRVTTNYQRLKAQLATTNGVIKMDRP